MSKEAMKLALEALENNRQTHYYCEDTWYSCPQHEEGCANDSAGDECICGADEANVEIDGAIAALREALAEQPAQQEPVAWMAYTKDGQSVYVTDNPTAIQADQRALPLYTSPQPTQRTWVGLTDEEIDMLEELYAPPVHPDFVSDADHCFSLIKKVEAKLKEKNNG